MLNINETFLIFSYRKLGPVFDPDLGNTPAVTGCYCNSLGTISCTTTGFNNVLPYLITFRIQGCTQFIQGDF